jgi:hypothetical protein
VFDFIVRILGSVSTPKLLEFSTLDFGILLLASLLLIGFGSAIKVYEYRQRLLNEQKVLEVAATRADRISNATA